MLNAKGFKSALINISKKSDELADLIHKAGMYALDQANTYGNFAPGYDLVDALGKKHDAKRVVIWLCHFGKFTVSNGILKASKKPVMEGWKEAAQAMPYYELTKQDKLIVKIDYLAMIKAVLAKQTKAQKMRDDGKEVIESNTEVLEKLSQFITQLEQPAS